MPPAVSVAMAVYNNAPYLREAIDSILNQTFTDFEFLIIDDGSSDGSLDILHHYAAIDPRIRLTHRENRGVPKTRNELVQQATADLIAVMDADDVALPDRLARQVALLRQHPEVVWVGGAFELIDEQGRLLKRFSLVEQDEQIRQYMLDVRTDRVFLHPTAMMRRSAVLTAGGYDETFRLASDLDLWFRMATVGKLANLPDPVVKYRIHNDSITGRNIGVTPKDAQTAFDRAWRSGLIREPIRVGQVCIWRPGTDRSSRYQFMLKYGWWAYESRQRQTALDYGRQAVSLKPLGAQGWKLLACALLKPFKPLPHAEAQ